MMDKRGGAPAHGQVEVGFDAVAVAVDDPVLEPRRFDRPPAPCPPWRRPKEADTPSKIGQQFAQRVVALAPPVVDEVEGTSAAPARRPSTGGGSSTHGRWRRPARPATHSWRYTELSTCRAAGLEAEGDVGQPEDREDAGQLRLDPAGCPRGVSIPSRRLSSIPVESGKARASNIRSVGAQPVPFDGHVVDGPGRPQLPLGGTGLALGVDAGAHHARRRTPGPARGTSRAERPASAPSSRLTELIMGPPPEPGEGGLGPPGPRSSRP